MAKTRVDYRNPLASDKRGNWKAVTGLEGIAEELTLALVVLLTNFIR